MFNFLKNVNESIKTADKLTAKNKFMTNPFSEVVNQTFVWTEKPFLLKRPLKK